MRSFVRALSDPRSCSARGSVNSTSFSSGSSRDSRPRTPSSAVNRAAVPGACMTSTSAAAARGTPSRKREINTVAEAGWCRRRAAQGGEVLLNVLEEPLETAYTQGPQQALPCASSSRVPRLHLRPVGRVVREACAEAGCGVQ